MNDKGLTTLLASAATAVVMFIVGAVTQDNVDVVPGEKALSPNDHEIAVKVACGKDDFKNVPLIVTKTVVPSNNYFVATWEKPGLRFDLTWQEGGTAIAVERTDDNQLTPWAEQVTPEFLACINEHQITIKDGTH